jgi:hypothetical protein
MGDHRSLSPARPDRLRWLEPAPPLPEAPRDLRARLEQIAARGDAREVYAARRRSVHRAEDPQLGAIAIKELRNPWPPRQVWFGWLAEHPGVREYRVAVAFAERGGRTLTSLGAAVERGPFGLARVLLFTRWLEGAVTLTRWLAERGQPPQPGLLAALASQIAAGARLGLVHQRHSSNNLLVVMQQGEPILYTIDFPHATLGAGLDTAGLAADVARIARWILHEKLWSRAAVQSFFEAVAAEVRAETPPGDDLAACMSRELEAVIRDPSARRKRSAQRAEGERSSWSQRNPRRPGA